MRVFQRGDRVKVLEDVDYWFLLADFRDFLKRIGFPEEAKIALIQEGSCPQPGWEGAVLAHPQDTQELWTAPAGVAVKFDNGRIGLIVRNYLQFICHDPDNNY